jgi:hypothetical protein
MTDKNNLYSTLKDGEPSGIKQNILAKMYPIILSILAFLIIYFYKHIKLNSRFIVYIFVGSLFGWTWNWFTVIYDSNYPGWLYHPWSVIFSNRGMVFEDFLFYPLCGALFYLVRYHIPDIGASKNSFKNIVLIVQFIIIVLLTYLFNSGGRSISLWFAIPGTLMLWITKDSWNLPRYFIVGMFVVLFGSNWDMIVTTIIPSIPGLAWASEWVYISFDAQGVAHHSTLWLDYSTHRWSWVGNIPIEIMYWFNISGWWFIYGLAQICEIKRVPK